MKLNQHTDYKEKNQNMISPKVPNISKFSEDSTILPRILEQSTLNRTENLPKTIQNHIQQKNSEKSDSSQLFMDLESEIKNEKQTKNQAPSINSSQAIKDSCIKEVMNSKVSFRSAKLSKQSSLNKKDSGLKEKDFTTTTPMLNDSSINNVSLTPGLSVRQESKKRLPQLNENRSSSMVGNKIENLINEQKQIIDQKAMKSPINQFSKSKSLSSLKLERMESSMGQDSRDVSHLKDMYKNLGMNYSDGKILENVLGVSEKELPTDIKEIEDQFRKQYLKDQASKEIYDKVMTKKQPLVAETYTSTMKNLDNKFEIMQTQITKTQLSPINVNLNTKESNTDQNNKVKISFLSQSINSMDFNQQGFEGRESQDGFYSNLENVHPDLTFKDINIATDVNSYKLHSHKLPNPEKHIQEGTLHSNQLLNQFNNNLNTQENEKGQEFYFFQDKGFFDPHELSKINELYNFKDEIVASKSKSMAKYLSKDLNLGPPSGRKEAERMSVWLTAMIDKYISNPEMTQFTDDFRIKSAQLIYSLCFKEIVRQVSSYCIERGLLLDRIWNSHITLYTVAEEKQKKECHQIKKEFDKGKIEAEQKFNSEVERVNGKIQKCIEDMVAKDRQILKQENQIAHHKEEVELLHDKISAMNTELNNIVTYQNKTGRLPVEQMGERLKQEEQMEIEQALEEEQRKKQVLKQRLEEGLRKATIKAAAAGLDGNAAQPLIAKRKMKLKKKDINEYNENDMKCAQLNQDQLMNLLNDDKVDESLKKSALRMLIENHGATLLEDAEGNKILVNEEGRAMLDESGKPQVVAQDLLDDLGVELGEPEGFVMDASNMDHLNLLANLCKGMSEDDARLEQNKKLQQAELDDWLATQGIEVEEEEGPSDGTKNKGLNTIPIPAEMSNPAAFDPSKVWIEILEQETLKALAEQYTLENPEGAATIANMILEQQGSEDLFEEVEEEQEEEVIDEDGNIMFVKKTRRVRRCRNDQLKGIREAALEKGSPLALALDSLPDAVDPDVEEGDEVEEEEMADGTKVKVIKKKDGSTLRKVVKETEAEQKLSAMKKLHHMDKGALQQERKLANQQKELDQEMQKLVQLARERDALNCKAEFKPPGVKGKVMKKVVDADGNEQFVEVDVQDDEFDDNASVYEEVVDEFGNKQMRKVDKDTLAQINDYKQEFKKQEEARINKLDEINNQLAQQQSKLNEQTKQMESDKRKMRESKADTEHLKSNLRRGSVKMKVMEVEKLKDGVSSKVGSDGKTKYFDSNGNEITKAKAFEKVKKEIYGDEMPEFEETIDPKTGKKVRKNIQQVEEIDKNGNVKMVRKDESKAFKKPTNTKIKELNKKGVGQLISDEDQEEVEVEELQADGSIAKVKKKVLNPQTQKKMTKELKNVPSDKFIYIDENGKMIVADTEPRNQRDELPITTQMIYNRINRVSFQCNQLEDKKHFKFVYEDVENNCLKECTKLKSLLELLIGKKEDKFLSAEEVKERKNRALEEKGKMMGLDAEAIEQLKKDPSKFPNINIENIYDNNMILRPRNSITSIENSADLGILSQSNTTNIQEFNIGKRQMKEKGDHKVHKFIETLKTFLDDPKLVSKANQPLNKINSLCGDIQSSKLAKDEIQKFSFNEQIQDQQFKKQGLQKMAENKLKDFLVNCWVYKEKSDRLMHVLELVGLHTPRNQDEILIQLDFYKWMHKFSLNSSSDVQEGLRTWYCKVEQVILAFKKIYQRILNKEWYFELLEQLKVHAAFDITQIDSELDDQKITQAFRMDFFYFIKNFVTEQWTKLRGIQEEKQNDHLAKNNVEIPQIFDMQTFNTTVELFPDRLENQQEIWSMFKKENEKMPVDQFFQIMISFDLFRWNKSFSEEQVEQEERKLRNFLLQRKDKDEYSCQCFQNYLRSLDVPTLTAFANNPVQIRAFSDKMFDKFDDDQGGSLDLDEFVNLCSYVDPKWDRTMCISKFNDLQNDNGKTVDKNEFFQFSKVHFKLVINEVLNDIDEEKNQFKNNYGDFLQSQIMNGINNISPKKVRGGGTDSKLSNK